MTRKIQLQDNLDEKLDEIQFDENPLWIDIRYHNRLGAVCLPILLQWFSTQGHKNMRWIYKYWNI